MAIQSLLTVVRSPEARLCLATSAATALAGAILCLIDRFVANWDDAEGLFLVSVFYFVLGMIALLQQEPPRTSSGDTYTTIDKWKPFRALGLGGPRRWPTGSRS